MASTTNDADADYQAKISMLKEISQVEAQHEVVTSPLEDRIPQKSKIKVLSNQKIMKKPTALTTNDGLDDDYEGKHYDPFYRLLEEMLYNHNYASLVTLYWQRTHGQEYLGPLDPGYDNFIKESDFNHDEWSEEWDDKSSYMNFTSTISQNKSIEATTHALVVKSRKKQRYVPLRPNQRVSFTVSIADETTMR